MIFTKLLKLWSALRLKNKEAVIRFPETLLSKDYFQDFIDQLRLEVIAQKSSLTEEQLWQLTEHIQQDW
jgi:hypothetical protein